MGDDGQKKVVSFCLGDLEMLVIDVPALPPAHALLTQEEAEVARLTVLGMSEEEIAGRRKVSRNTVGDELRTLLEKLDIDSTSQLEVALASVDEGD